MWNLNIKNHGSICGVGINSMFRQSKLLGNSDMFWIHLEICILKQIIEYMCTIF